VSALTELKAMMNHRDALIADGASKGPKVPYQEHNDGMSIEEAMEKGVLSAMGTDIADAAKGLAGAREGGGNLPGGVVQGVEDPSKGFARGGEDQ